ncbi:MAG: glycosyltransferase, partial [Deltaproteobacteria bacterium]|nr:glycosyltransferase [Deltaproteobacteria bacterium]
AIGLILRLGKPVVWRLSDMWPFTGGCHYSGGCLRYEASCGRCPLLGSRREYDLSRIVWSSKRRYWDTRNLTVVSPSQWLADCASRSALFREARVEVIPTGVDTTLFRPVPRRRARSLLGLPQDKDLVLFGAADSMGDPRKGGQFLQEIFEVLRAGARVDSMCLVAFGTWVPPKDVGVETIAVGTLWDEPSLAILYSACDVFVAPYMEDNLPNTIIESLSCGTPCVAFRVGGIPELIAHRENGYLAPPFDTGEMAQGIRFVLDSDYQALRRRTRRKAERDLSLKRCAESYVSLFSELLQDRDGCAESSRRR